MPINTEVSTAVRVYNYSFVKTGEVTVSAKFQPCELGDPPDVSKAEAIANATIAMIPGRGDEGAPNNWQDLKINWTTPSEATFGYLHIVLSTPDVKIEDGTGKAMLLDSSGKVVSDKNGNPMYSGGNLNTNNDQGYVLVGIYDPQTIVTAAAKPVKSSQASMMVGASAPARQSEPASTSSNKSLTILANSLAVRPINNRTMGDSATTLAAGQKAMVQAQLRFDDAKGDKTSAVTKVNVYLRDNTGVVSHKVIPLLFNGRTYTVRMPYTAPGDAQAVPLEMTVSSAALPPAAGSAKTVLTISRP